MQVINKYDYLKSSYFYPISLICFLTFSISYISPATSTIIGIVISFILILRARPDGLLGLMLLYMSKYQFYNLDLGALGDEQRDIFVIAGYPLTVPTAVCGFVSLRVILEVVFNPKTLKRYIPNTIILLWLIAFIPIVCGFYLGSIEKNANWTRGLRFWMLTGSYFYGVILTSNWPINHKKILIPILIPMTIIALTLHAIGLWWSHTGWLFLGLSGSFSIYYYRKKSFLLAILLLFLTLNIALLGSFTTMFIGLLAIILSFITTLHKKYNLINTNKKDGFSKYRVNNYLVKYFVLILFILLAVFMITSGTYALNVNYNPSMRYGDFYGSLDERLKAKILSDRLVIWRAAVRQIIENPIFIVPSGAPMFLNVPGWPTVWEVGAHNVILETLRIEGLFAGSLILIILYSAIKNNNKIIIENSDPILLAFSSGVLSVIIVGLTTGDFPIDQTVGFFLWAFAGISHGLSMKDKYYQYSSMK